MVTPGIREDHVVPWADINISLVQSSETDLFELYIQGIPYETSIRLDVFQDLQLLYTRVASNLTEESQYFTADRCKNYIIENLISAGRAAFNQLFGDAQRYLKHQIHKVNSPEPLTVLFSSPFPINAGWFYSDLEKPDEQYSNKASFAELLSHFWDIKFNLIQIPLIKQSTHAFTEFLESPFESTSTPSHEATIGLVIDKLLPHTDYERTGIQNCLNSQHSKLLVEFTYSDEMDTTNFRGKLTDFIYTEYIKMLHFACEVKEDDVPSQSNLRFRNSSSSSETHLTYRIVDLQQKMMSRIRAELVFLNCCSGGVSRVGHSISFTQAFMNLGSRVIVASSVPVESSIAASFASFFYGYLYSGISVGSSVLFAKRKVLEQLTRLDDISFIYKGDELQSPQLSLYALFYRVYGDSTWKLES